VLAIVSGPPVPLDFPRVERPYVGVQVSLTKIRRLALEITVTDASSGIYIIENTMNGRCYIGGSTNVHQRLKIHHSQLNNKNHFNWNLNQDLKVYDIADFTCSLLEKCDVDELVERETAHIVKYQLSGRPKLYNTKMPIARDSEAFQATVRIDAAKDIHELYEITHHLTKSHFVGDLIELGLKVFKMGIIPNTAKGE